MMVTGSDGSKRSIFDWICLPWHALEVLSGEKGFKTPIIGSERLNRRGLHVWRMKATHAITARRRGRLAKFLSADERADFDRNGFLIKHNVLTSGEHAALIAELRSVTAPAREMTEGLAVTRRIAVTPELLHRTPVLRRFLDNPDWRRLTRYVGGFDIEPLVCIQTIFGAAGVTAPSDPQTQLHMDTFHPTMKAWYFLEEVEADKGPFTYVPGSHRLTRRRMAWHKRKSVIAATGSDKGGSFRVPDGDLNRLRLPPRQVFAVPGNTLVVGDTFGLHARGQSLRPSVRVEIYASMRPNPFIPVTFLDTSFIPFVRGRKEVIGWWMEDLMARLGLGRTIWKKAGTGTPWERSKETTNDLQ